MIIILDNLLIIKKCRESKMKILSKFLEIKNNFNFKYLEI